MIGIYVHVPFCRTRCPYCDFVSQPISGDIPRAFVEAVCREAAAFEGPDDAYTVFLGGGTPSLLGPTALAAILGALRRRFRFHDPEITIEANPDDVDRGLARAWRDLGVNRVSLGVQGFDDAALRYLGRRHDAACAHQACEIVAGHFDNWAMDLIFGAHPTACWPATLDACVAHRPPHVAAYGLTYEKGTPFGARSHEAVDEATWLALYRQASERLNGYDHYEISNFALPGCACKHNLIYWQNLEYAGFGPAAYSFINGVRARNTVQLEEYMAEPGRKAERLCLTEREIRLETVIQHFRLRGGLPKRAYVERFGHSVFADHGGALHGLLARGLLEQDAGAIRPTRQGFELNNEIGLALVGP